MKALVLLSLLLVGCWHQRGSISTPLGTVVGVPDAGKPASLDSQVRGESLPLPAGSIVTVTKSEAMAAQPAYKNIPAREAQPAKEVTEIKLAKDTVWQKQENSVKADTGTIDTSVALKKVEVAERRWLLWTAIACGIAGIVLKSMLPAWPGLSNGLLLAAAVAGASWKLADVPAWVWAAVLCVVALLALGYKRAQWDANGDGIPDVFQKKPEGEKVLP